MSKGTNFNLASDIAMENASKISEGDLNNIKFISGPQDAALRKAILESAYEECERITGIFAKTFYLGTKFMSPEGRKAVWAIYVWCRRTDDIVDGPRAMVRGRLSLQKDLDAWTQRLRDVFQGQAKDSLDLALADTKMRYPTLSIKPFEDMIGGMIMDIPGTGKMRYKNFNELEEYCYRVAGTVGLMTLPVLGTAKGVTEEEAKEPALALGIALQLTNILRDVGEDVARERIYLPLDELEKFGVKEANIMNGILDENYKKLMAFQIARTRFYYAKAAKGVPMLAPESRLPVQASLDMYGKILNSIEENGYDNFRKRAYVSKNEKIFTIPLSWWKSINLPDMSQLEQAEKELAKYGKYKFQLTRFDLLPNE